jgi:hypothetical protein
VSGSAIIFTSVLSLPIPDKDTSAATLMFAGNNKTASRAVPSKIIVEEERESKLISEVSKNFAPFKERGCFVVVIDTDSNSCLIDFVKCSIHHLLQHFEKLPQLQY